MLRGLILEHVKTMGLYTKSKKLLGEKNMKVILFLVMLIMVNTSSAFIDSYVEALEKTSEAYNNALEKTSEAYNKTLENIQNEASNFPIEESKLNFRNGKYYRINSQVPFTGKIINYFQYSLQYSDLKSINS